MREHLRSNRGALIAGIVMLILGVGLNVAWLLQDLRAVQLHVVNVLPGVLLLIAWYLASALPRRRRVFLGLGLTLTLLGVGLAALFNVSVALFLAAISPIDDVARYEAVLRDRGYPDARLVAHFPAHIPGNATRVSFYYLPKFWQGPLLLQLRCQLPPSEVDAVWQRYRATARQVQNAAGDVIEGRAGEDALPTTVFQDPDDPDSASPVEGFLVLILDAEPCSTDPVDWNHGYSYGVAASTERHEVIYWAIYW